VRVVGSSFQRSVPATATVATSAKCSFVCANEHSLYLRFSS
jgi:hypothetical protein